MNEYYHCSTPAKTSPSAPQSPASPLPQPTIAEFMPADQEYITFLLSGNHAKSPGKVHHAQNLNPDSFMSLPFNLQISRFLIVFSFIGTIILFIFGLLIEIQPLYIKGISPARTPLHRNLHGHYSTYSWVHFSARLRILNNLTFSNESTDHKEMDRMMESMGMVFEMKKEAKVAFKASALYFLVMMLSIVYNQNHVLIHAKYARWNVSARIRSSLDAIRLHAVRLIRRYRRRHYSHVQEVHGLGSGRRSVTPVGLGLAKLNINAIHRSRSQSRDTLVDQKDDSDSGLEELGLSMVQRPRQKQMRKSSSNSSIVRDDGFTTSLSLAGFTNKTKKK